MTVGRVLRWGIPLCVVLVAIGLLLVDDEVEDGLGAPAGDRPSPVAASGDKPSGAPAGTWTESACPVDPGDTDVAVTCGYLSVPADRADRADPDDRADRADRADPDGATIDLAVAVLHALEEGHADAVLYLTGGPGGSGLAELEAWTTDGLLAGRDVVLLDQRGTGWSRPSLGCPELAEADDDFKALRSCRDRLAGAGVDLDVYRTAEIAADVADLRAALGYDEWNLWGSSYGTRVALAVLRDHPQGIRSVVLEGAYPPQVDAYADTVAAGVAAVEGLMDACAADATCDGAYSELYATFVDAVVHLDQDPVVLDDDTELDGLGFAEAVVAGLGQSAAVGLMPAWIAAIADGGTEPLEALVERRGRTRDGSDSDGLFYLVECAEEIAHSRLAEVDAEDVADVLEVDLDDVVAASQSAIVASTVDACALWAPPPVDAAVRRPVTSDVPALVISGALDPQTPPWWAEQAAAGLRNGHLLIAPGMGHDVIDAHVCPRGIFEAFIDDPTAPVDTACLAAMTVEFAPPG
ncbi:MAG: alpha/beta hydrolase [Egibacteraceae bacterium]